MSNNTSEPSPAAASASESPATTDYDKLLAFVQEETRRMRRGVVLTYSLGIVAAALIAGYMGFILYFLNQMIEPRTLAGMVALQAREATPDLVESVEASLVEQANLTANSISKRFIKLVPEFSKAGRDYIDMTHEEAIPYLSEEFSSIIKDYINEHSETLQAFAEDHSAEEFAEFFTEALVEEFTRQIDRHMRENYEGRNLEYLHDNLNLSLAAMDQTLDDLLAADPNNLTRRQELQRKLIAHLFNYAVKKGDAAAN